jgi:hypothetical protein
MDPLSFTPLLFWLTVATVLLNRLRPKREQMESTAYWLPLAIAAGSALAGWLKNRSANNAQKDALNQANVNAAKSEQAVKDLFAQLEARGIDPYRNITTQSESGTSSTSGTSRTTGTQRQRKVIDPTTARMSGLADAQLEALLASPQKITEGEKLNYARNANLTSEGARRAVENVAASRGLSGAQAGALAVPVETDRTRNILNYLASIPQQERDIATALRGEAQGVTNARMGSDIFSDSTTRSNSTTNSSSSGRSEGPANIGMLAQLLGPRDRVSTNTGYSAAGNLLGSAADAGAAYYGMTNGQPTSGSKKCPPGTYGTPPYCEEI